MKDLRKRFRDARDRRATIAYVVTTALLAITLAVAGALELARWAPIVDEAIRLGYPAYLETILGTWKLLGALAIVAPALPRLKEWAYAGIMFDLTGASISHAVAGSGAVKIATPLALLALAFASWALRPEGRRLPKRAPRAAEPRAAPDEDAYDLPRILLTSRVEAPPPPAPPRLVREAGRAGSASGN
jgi:uncharacterized membrane protein YphA (DoxX/SURF4 family)